MNVEITQLHQNSVWYSNGYWQTYLPTNDGRYIRGRYEGKRMSDKDKHSFIFRVNYFYQYGTVLSKQEAINILYGFSISTEKDYKSHIKYCPSCVYEYIDKNDGLVKYVGIVYKQSLLERHTQHLYSEKWCNESDFYIRYVVVKNRSEAEALESHLIAMHKSYMYYNTSKNDWGINSMLENYNPTWLEFSPQKCRKVIRNQKEKQIVNSKQHKEKEKQKEKNNRLNNIDPSPSGRRRMRRKYTDKELILR